ncbi:terminase large subunit [Halorubrum sodomense tailed virus 2]|uniref:Terminase large subunit n=1 Tax=Halorubrum sodomense tailed virus 2 TaxID=1262527 RepID=L7THH1_9CAUD|nr:terminase large subunit [Halorubrum sodomense tailed virus 2]AGC34276.1 terminase large subunit [Halorubrum sodomense tailed virus 2]UBF22155.1 terminase large subunit [Halorubrum virus HRTV-2]
MEEVAQTLADQQEIQADALLERWGGKPEVIAEDLFRARDPDTGLMKPIELFDYQVQFLHAYFFGKAPILNVYKGRRIGISYAACMALIIDGLRHPRMTFPVVATSLDHAQDRIEDIRTLLEHSPLPYDDIVEVDNKGEIELSNGAIFKAFTANPDKLRGISARTVFIDEMAFIENQQEVIDAAMPTISLGETGKVLEVSTPRVSNDLFIETNKRGLAGDEDVIAIKQPTFKNAENIDIEVPLTKQDAEVVRPDMNADAFESQRLSDPRGFAQEYLCRPLSDEYRFLSKDAVEAAQKRGAVQPELFNEGVGGGKKTEDPHYWHPATHARCGGMMVMGVDIGIDRDDTAVAVFEHVGEQRFLRFHTLVDRNDLRSVGVFPEDPKNPEAIADYIYRVSENMGVEKVFVDMTGPGRGFQQSIQQRLGNRAQGFNFSDKTELERMWGDLNYALHSDLVHLVPDKTMHDQLLAIVKEQSYEDVRPRFTGKEYSEDSKDDLAMAVVLASFPPNFKADRSTSLHQRENVSGQEFKGIDKPDDAEGEGGVRELRQRHASRRQYGDSPHIPDGVRLRSGGSSSRSMNRYSSRHSRRRSSR